MNRNKRIIREIKKGCESSIMEFFDDSEGEFGDKDNCYIRFCLKDGPYANQVHVLQVRFVYGSNTIYKFPIKPPNITFITPIYHANVYRRGAICLDILNENKWSAMFDVDTIMNSLWLLLDTPNHSSPAHGDASRAAKKSTPEEFQQQSMDYYLKNLHEGPALGLLACDKFQSGLDADELTARSMLRRDALAVNNITI